MSDDNPCNVYNMMEVHLGYWPRRSVVQIVHTALSIIHGFFRLPFELQCSQQWFGLIDNRAGRISIDRKYEELQRAISHS